MNCCQCAVISTKLLVPLETNCCTSSQQQSTCRSQLYYKVFGSDNLINSSSRIEGLYLILSLLSKHDNSFMNCEDNINSNQCCPCIHATLKCITWILLSTLHGRVPDMYLHRYMYIPVPGTYIYYRHNTAVMFYHGY